MAGACGVASRRLRRASSHGAGGRAVTMGQAIDVVDVPVELARPVVTELTAGRLRAPVLRRGRWAVLTAPRRRAGFALPESLIRAKVRLLPADSQLALPSKLGARTDSGDGDWDVPPDQNQLLPPCSVVVALLERVAQGRTSS